MKGHFFKDLVLIVCISVFRYLHVSAGGQKCQTPTPHQSCNYRKL